MKGKKMAAVLISTVMVLGLAGCGSQNTQGSRSGQNSVSTVQATDGGTGTQSISVSEQSDTVERTAETLPDASTETSLDVSTDNMAGAMTEAADSARTEASTETLTNHSTEETSEPSQAENESGKTLVVYYSATGNTENVANDIAAATGADLFELEPVNPYSADDLNWTDDNSRVVYEHDNPDARVVELVSATVDNWDSNDTVFIGFPN